MEPELLRLLQLADPALPIGGFSHSFGLETYVQKKMVTDKKSASIFISGMLKRNIRYTDAAFVALAYDAALQRDPSALQYLNDLCMAVKIPMETRQATLKLGNRLMKVFAPLLQQPEHFIFKAEMVPSFTYPVAFGLIAQTLQIDKRKSLSGFYYNAASTMVTNCVKLIPLGQLEGQQLLFSLQPLMHELVECSLFPDPEMIGLSSPGFDLRSMQHEQLYSRLYMS